MVRNRNICYISPTTLKAIHTSYTYQLPACPACPDVICYLLTILIEIDQIFQLQALSLQSLPP